MAISFGYLQPDGKCFNRFVEEEGNKKGHGPFRGFLYSEGKSFE